LLIFQTIQSVPARLLIRPTCWLRPRSP